MVLYDMLRNATRVSLEDIVRRQAILGNGYDVLQPVKSVNWKAPYMSERAEFIRVFYDYARANPNGRPQLWSEWVKTLPHGVDSFLSRSLRIRFPTGENRR